MPRAKQHTLLGGLGVAQGCACLDCVPTSVEQNLQELDFMRSACAAAQHGNVERLREIVTKRPQELMSDGSGLQQQSHLLSVAVSTA
jgi:hypothetical protein